jgi:hypothetical protein
MASGSGNDIHARDIGRRREARRVETAVSLRREAMQATCHRGRVAHARATASARENGSVGTRRIAGAARGETSCPGRR